MLDHERVDVYRASLELVREALHMADRLARGFGPVADQLGRAAVSERIVAMLTKLGAAKYGT